MSLSDLQNRLKGYTKLVIIGIGNEMNGDDAAGMFIAKELQKTINNPKINIFLGGTTPENLTGPIKKTKPSHILIIDAADFEGEPGETKILDKDQIEGAGFSTHSFPLSVFVDYLKNETGAEVILLGIQPKRTGAQDGMSKEVKEAVRAIINLINSFE